MDPGCAWGTEGWYRGVGYLRGDAVLLCHEYLAHDEAVPATPPVPSAFFSGFAELLRGGNG